MSIKSLLLASIVLGLSFTGAKAQILTAGHLALDGSNIQNIGDVVYAYNLDFASTTTTVNGVTFVGSNVFNGSTPNFDIAGGGFDGTGGGTSPTDAVYTLNQNGVYGALTLTLKNLTPGDFYNLQLIIDAQPPDTRFQQYVDTTNTPVGSPTVTAGLLGPQYITDQFIATGTTETLQAQYGGGAGAQLSGFVLSTPEPSTWALFALCLGGLGFYRMRRSMARS